ncbi:VQ motif-containing protein 25-like [Hordeum vulgare]|uniref:VQ domain-containing protein n=1 Tax=Hordeum vulgare subsp. vulgare TaxID=112509 RepID=A0A8I6XQE5_HORVV|nr:uncharacterized protein LOC123427993 [Hordeum vulgare subsp. vulgare]KAE8776661.1 VQ motif-containing protein 25-like [Hordeum vulgare]KAI5010620.1 hypothetical protein ZWY2020_012757 [Hordeum vulgare]
MAPHSPAVKLQSRAAAPPSSAMGAHRWSHPIAKGPPRKIRIVHVLAPEVIKTDARHFRDLVQRLTGKPSAAGGGSSSSSSSWPAESSSQQAAAGGSSSVAVAVAPAAVKAEVKKEKEDAASPEEGLGGATNEGFFQDLDEFLLGGGWL